MPAASGASRPLVPRASKSTPALFRPNGVQAAAVMPRDEKTFTSEARVQHAFARAWWIERTGSPSKRSGDKVTYLQSQDRHVGYEPMRSYRSARKGWDGKDGRRYAPARVETLEPPVSDIALVGGSLVHASPTRPATHEGIPGGGGHGQLTTPSTFDSLAVRTAARSELMIPSATGSPTFLPGGRTGGTRRRVSKEIMEGMIQLPNRMRRASKEVLSTVSGRVRRASNEVSATVRTRRKSRESAGDPYKQDARSSSSSSFVRERRLQSRQDARRTSMFG